MYSNVLHLLCIAMGFIHHRMCATTVCAMWIWMCHFFGAAAASGQAPASEIRARCIRHQRTFYRECHFYHSRQSHDIYERAVNVLMNASCLYEQ
jgi:hypothetical protein